MGNCLPAGSDERAGGLSKRSKPQLRSFSELQTSSLASKSERSEWVATLAQVLEESSGTEVEKRYQLGEELGRGEFGVTRRCKDVETGESFACKSISKEKLQTEVDIEDVRREVQIMRHLPCHPNIVRLREVFEDSHAVHLVMELCEGGELFERIVARGHYTERAAAAVTKTMVEVVKLCHEHGVMHRDLKPENFLYADKSETSPLKTIDFGLSIFFKPGQRFNEVVGSPYYMAPEILRRNYGPEADVWSAGIILYILLCGVPPFWAEDEDEIAQLIIEAEQSDIDFEREPWPKISGNAKDLVRSMLDPNPYSRLTAGEVLEHTWLKNVNLAPNIPLGETVRTRLKQFSAMNKLKKRALRILAEHITGDEVDGIKQMFQMMDTNKNGNLTFEELKEGLQKMGEPVHEPDVKMLMEAADVDGNGTLDCNEFVTVSVHLKRISSDDHLSEAFKFFDKNGNGFIEIDELKETLLEGDHSPANMKMLADIIYDVDTDKDGRISYQEFASMMKAGADWRNASQQYSTALLNTLSKKLIRGVSTIERNAPNL